MINDLGGSVAGEGEDFRPAQQVVKEIEQLGGEAAVNGANVADFQAAGEMVPRTGRGFVTGQTLSVSGGLTMA